jgi:hypothetical protein
MFEKRRVAKLAAQPAVVRAEIDRVIAVVEGGASLPARSTNRGASVRRLGAVVLFLVTLTALTALTGCGSSRRGQPDRPGGGLPADHDATTVLASTATQVAIETVTGSCVYRSTSDVPCAITAVRTAQFLQGDHNHSYRDAANADHIHDLIAAQLFAEFKARPGNSYLVFASFDRGMSGCISALYRYDPNSKTATFIESRDGPVSGVIQLPDRTLRVPRTVSLDYVLARMNPSGGPVYPADASESWCPGP